MSIRRIADNYNLDLQAVEIATVPQVKDVVRERGLRKGDVNDCGEFHANNKSLRG